MTTTRPAPSLADVIRDAEYQWKDLHLAGMAGYNALPRGSRVDHIAAAVAAHLASDAVIERMARAMTAWQYADTQGRREAIEGDMRAAVAAALVGEGGNG